MHVHIETHFKISHYVQLLCIFPESFRAGKLVGVTHFIHPQCYLRDIQNNSVQLKHIPCITSAAKKVNCSKEDVPNIHARQSSPDFLQGRAGRP